MQPDRVVVLDELGNEPSSVCQAQRGLDANAPSFQGFVPPLHLAVDRWRVATDQDGDNPGENAASSKAEMTRRSSDGITTT